MTQAVKYIAQFKGLDSQTHFQQPQSNKSTAKEIWDNVNASCKDQDRTLYNKWQEDLLMSIRFIVLMETNQFMTTFVRFHKLCECDLRFDSAQLSNSSDEHQFVQQPSGLLGSHQAETAQALIITLETPSPQPTAQFFTELRFDGHYDSNC
ncbi:hypothetical protein Tco_0326719 [Tanacetum coccineum]